MTTQLSLDKLIIEAKSLADILQHCNGFNGVEISDDDLIKIILLYYNLSNIDSIINPDIDPLTNLDEVLQKLKSLLDYLNKCSNSLKSIKKRYYQKYKDIKFDIHDLIFDKVSNILLIEYCFGDFYKENNLGPTLRSKLSGFTEILFANLGLSFTDKLNERLIESIQTFRVERLYSLVLILRYTISCLCDIIDNDKDINDSIRTKQRLLLYSTIKSKNQQIQIPVIVCAKVHELINGEIISQCRDLVFCKFMNLEKIKKSERITVKENSKMYMYYVIYLLGHCLDSKNVVDWREYIITELKLNINTYNSHIHKTVNEIEAHFNFTGQKEIYYTLKEAKEVVVDHLGQEIKINKRDK